MTKALSNKLENVAISRLSFVVVEDSYESAHGTISELRLSTSFALSPKIRLYSHERLSLGEELTFVGSFSRADEELIAKGYAGTARLSHVVKRSTPNSFLYVVSALRARVLERIYQEAPDDAALIAALVCGDKSKVKNEGLDQLFSVCGISHLLAISGMHIMSMTVLIESVCEKLDISIRSKCVIVLALSLAFTLFCGAPASALRAWLMTALASLVNLQGRSSHALSSVSLVGLAFILIDPYQASNLGFVLSLVCVLALSIFGPYVRYHIDIAFGKMRFIYRISHKYKLPISDAIKELKKSLSTTAICQLASASLIIPLSGRISLIGPLAAFLLSELAILLFLSSLVSVLLIPLIPKGAFAVSALLSRILLQSVKALTTLPFASVCIELDARLLLALLLIVALIILIVWPCFTRAQLLYAAISALFLFAFPFVRSRYFDVPQLCVLDVGQGDAILVKDKGKAILIDVGPDDQIVHALGRQHIAYLDAIVITHLHDDHYGGLKSLIGSVCVGKVYVGEGVSAALGPELSDTIQRLSGCEALELCYKSSISSSHVEMKHVSPVERRDGSVNEDSLQFVCTFKNAGNSFSALLTGDAENEVLTEIIERGDVGQIDVLKLGHHGSAASIDANNLNVLAPCVAIASAGENNRFHHPHPSCVELLTSNGVVFACTKNVGDVKLFVDKRGLCMSTQHEAHGTDFSEGAH